MKHREKSPEEKKPEFPWRTTVLLLGIFMIIGGSYIILQYYGYEPIPYRPLTTDVPMPNAPIYLDTRLPENNTSFKYDTIRVEYCNPSCFENAIRGRTRMFDSSRNYVIFGKGAEIAAKTLSTEGFANLFILEDYENWTE